MENFLNINLKNYIIIKIHLFIHLFSKSLFIEGVEPDLSKVS